jgi:glucose-6-phosphate isomerase
MANFLIDPSRVFSFIDKNSISSLQNEMDTCFENLIQKKGKGNDFLGWLDLPEKTLQSDIPGAIVSTVNELKNNCDLIVVIGIGGSYLGAKAIITALNHHFKDFLPTDYPDIIYAGHQISQDYMADLLSLLGKRNYGIVVISKSGTTTEPALAFRILKDHLENKIGKEQARKRIVAITDKAKGALKKLATAEGYPTFDIPDDVGGRFSVLTPVGLLPIALAGFDILKLLSGAAAMQKELMQSSDIYKNPACTYAAVRNALYRNGKTIEVLVNFQPNLIYFSEWWKQLYGESEGKEHKGLFTASVNFTTDLHSLGQYLQDGLRNLFETMILVEKPSKNMNVPLVEDDADGLNFIAGKSIHEVNQMAALGTTLAHLDGGVPVIHIKIPEVNEYILGELIYFYEFACALSGYMLKVNPFDQPGVEAYKNNMFALLGKSGYEALRKEITERIK